MNFHGFMFALTLFPICRLACKEIQNGWTGSNLVNFFYLIYIYIFHITQKSVFNEKKKLKIE